MAEGKIPGVRNVSKKEVSALSKLPWVLDEALSEFGEARVLPDGRVLQYMPGESHGKLYPSREALAEMSRSRLEFEREAAKRNAAGHPPDILTLLPPTDDFLGDVEVHAGSLGARIRVPGEVLDRSVESLVAVDKALKRIPWAKRQVHDLVTPLVAYVGEVMRRASGGRWVKSTHKHHVARCDPEELLALWATKRKLQPIAAAAADKAAAEAKARGASASDVEAAYFAALMAIQEQAPDLKSYRREEREDSEPVIVASNGQSFQPFALVFVPMIEPSKRLPLRNAVGTTLHVSGYPAASKPAA